MNDVKAGTCRKERVLLYIALPPVEEFTSQPKRTKILIWDYSAINKYIEVNVLILCVYIYMCVCDIYANIQRDTI